jgi:hypothetical protein
VKHFVGYHNFERMERTSEYDPIEPELPGAGEAGGAAGSGHLFGFATGKKPDRFLGNVLWGIQGQGKPRDYFLFDWFLVEAVEKIGTGPFGYWLRGSRGVSIDSGIFLNDLPWFPEFRTLNRNFSMGIQEIAPRFVPPLCALLRAAGLPLPPGCDRTSASAPGDAEERKPSPRRGCPVDRILLDTAVTEQVKGLHHYRCQVCGTRLETAAGPYAEGAHVRPLGPPHDGPDSADNVLCLCPNHHVLFEHGAFSVADDLSCIGLQGKLRTVSGHTLSPAHLRYHRERIYRPRLGGPP